MTADPSQGERYWAAIEPHWLALNESWDAGEHGFRSATARVPQWVVHLYAVHWLHSEVENGGLLQFFANTTGLLAPEAVAGLRAIGLQEWAAVLEEAMRFFGTPYPRDPEVRLAALPPAALQYFGIIERRAKSPPREEWDPFVQLDERFYSAAESDPDAWERAADAYAAAAA